MFFSACFGQARVPVAKRRPAAAIKRGGKGKCKRATARSVRKPSLKKEKVVEIVFLPARPDKPLPACGWARSKPDGKIWFAPYNANFAKTQPLNLKVAGTSGFLHNFGSMLRFFER